jgi:hypothetical protein
MGDWGLEMKSEDEGWRMKDGDGRWVAGFFLSQKLKANG